MFSSLETVFMLLIMNENLFNFPTGGVSECPLEKCSHPELMMERKAEVYMVLSIGR